MGQKIRPSGLRLGIIREWDSRWYADRNYREFLLDDIKIRKYVLQKHHAASISGILIERRVGDAVRVTVHTAKPGVLIGRGGAGVEDLKRQLETVSGRRIHVNVVEIKNPDLNAELVAESVARSIERRESFRRAMKQAVQRTMKQGARGVKVIVSGRLGGADIARTESLKDGKIPLHTIRADIDYGVRAARTKYGPIGIKVWVYRGDVLPGEKIKRDTEARVRRPGGGRAPRVRQAPSGPSISVGGPGAGPRGAGPGRGGRPRSSGGRPTPHGGDSNANA